MTPYHESVPLGFRSSRLPDVIPAVGELMGGCECLARSSERRISEQYSGRIAVTCMRSPEPHRASNRSVGTSLWDPHEFLSMHRRIGRPKDHIATA